MVGCAKQIRLKLEELTRLWIDPTRANLQRICELCEELEESAVQRSFGAGSSFGGGIDQHLLHQVELLATKAEKRLADCLCIQTRTGAYSMCGLMETLERVATVAWEG